MSRCIVRIGHCILLDKVLLRTVLYQTSGYAIHGYRVATNSSSYADIYFTRISAMTASSILSAVRRFESTVNNGSWWGEGGSAAKKSNMDKKSFSDVINNSMEGFCEKPAQGDNENINENTRVEGKEEGVSSRDIQVSGNARDVTKKQKSIFLVPSDDIVIETARKALNREGRDHIVDAIIWSEDTGHYPILAQGKKNVYDYTDDIPLYVIPFWGHEWYQQREYFQQARLSKNWWYYAKTYVPIIIVVLFAGFLATFVHIWINQPKELQAFRGEILQNAYGRVLEVAAGHGQNIGVYPYPVHTIVLADSNAQQLQTLRYRIPKTAYPKYEIRKMRSERLEGFKDAEFDCVVDMFGLCHYRDPIMALRQMQRVVKPTGMIILLEHGRSRSFFVNWILDHLAKNHLINTHGCHWNRPIREYLKETRLEVKELRNEHFGTTYYIVAYPENIATVQETVDKLKVPDAFKVAPVGAGG